MKYMKLVFIVMLALVLVSCDESSPYDVDEVIESLSIEFASGDDANHVTQDITLPFRYLNSDDVTIQWMSSDPDIINVNGTVQRPDVDTEVTLYLSVKIDSDTRQKAFDLIVLGTDDHVVTLDILGYISTWTVEDEEVFDRPDDPDQGDYVFLGWSTESTDSDVFFDFSEPITSSITLYAVFERAEYRIELYKEMIGGSGYVLDGYVTDTGYVGETITFDEAQDGFTVSSTSTTDGTISVEETLVLEIYYDRLTYDVTFMSEGVAVSVENVKYEDTVYPPNPNRAGYTLDGWADEDGMSFDFSDPITEDITLYAVWTDDTTYTGYYEGIDGLYGDDLFLELNDIVNFGVTMQSYGDARYILNISDQDPDNPNNVILVYTNQSVDGTWDFGATWNREHVWPQSLLGVSTNNSSRHEGADLHNLKPAQTSENGSRGNKYYDDFMSTSSYEPRDEVKGDVARILFYMVVMYDHLELVSQTPGTYQMAMFDVLLEWHADDPVDDFERNRNDVIATYQNNRNPFIDHPELVDKIWGLDATDSNTFVTNLNGVNVTMLAVVDGPRKKQYA
jgi:uncharacterized repeat protein (TIGR02543 family)